MTTTIAVKESTAERLKRIMKEKETKSLDQTINLLIETAEGIPSSMFGADRNRRMRLTRHEHEEFQKWPLLEVVDTFAWIEYFAGSERGQRVRQYVESGEAITPSIVIAEFTDKYEREGMSTKERLTFIRGKSTISPLDDDVAEAAGKISAQRRTKVKGWGLVDSVVLATARAKGVRVVTGDEHFRDLTDAVMIK
jgi:predicted nucleic acid-binding protein